MSTTSVLASSSDMHNCLGEGMGLSRVVPVLLLALLLGAGARGQSADNELVNVRELIENIVLDLKYNTIDNFTGQKLYTSDECLLALGAVRRLRIVQDSLNAR